MAAKQMALKRVWEKCLTTFLYDIYNNFFAYNPYIYFVSILDLMVWSIVFCASTLGQMPFTTLFIYGKGLTDFLQIYALLAAQLLVLHVPFCLS